MARDIKALALVLREELETRTWGPDFRSLDDDVDRDEAVYQPIIERILAVLDEDEARAAASDVLAREALAALQRAQRCLDCDIEWRDCCQRDVERVLLRDDAQRLLTRGAEGDGDA